LPTFFLLAPFAAGLPRPALLLVRRRIGCCSRQRRPSALRRPPAPALCCARRLPTRRRAAPRARRPPAAFTRGAALPARRPAPQRRPRARARCGRAPVVPHWGGQDQGEVPVLHRRRRGRPLRRRRPVRWLSLGCLRLKDMLNEDADSIELAWSCDIRRTGGRGRPAKARHCCRRQTQALELGKEQGQQRSCTGAPTGGALFPQQGRRCCCSIQNRFDPKPMGQG